MQAPPGRVVDHIDGDIRNNSRRNLRVCSNGQNVQNAHTPSAHRYTGVYPIANGSFNVKIGRISAGCYYTEQDAARVYDIIAEIIYGAAHTRLNVPLDQRPYTDIEVFTTSKLGWKGVDHHKLSGLYNARYRRKSLGYFKFPEDAYNRWAIEWWRELLKRSRLKSTVTNV
jgi:hypothetical protein